MAKQTNVSPELATVPLSEMLRMFKAMRDVRNSMLMATAMDDTGQLASVMDAFEPWLG